LQQRGKSVPDYKLVNTGGEAHSRLFTVSCKITDVDREVSAIASSRRKAEQMVAEQLLIELELSS
jgi:ribonuclease-3